MSDAPTVFPNGTSSVETRSGANRLRYSICTMVSRPAEYQRLVAGFRAGGFDTPDCEFLFVDNSAGNRFDAYAAYNRFLLDARGDYLILCHQDVELLQDGRARLDDVLGELQAVDSDWGLCGNAGGVRFGELAIRISGPNFDNTSQGGPFPVRCHSLDENFIVVRRGANLALPRDRLGFHFYGTELCLLADMLGWHAYVVDFHLYHHGLGELDASFLRQLNLFINKYEAGLRWRWISTPCVNLFISSSRLLNALANRRLPIILARYLFRLTARRPRRTTP